MGRMRFVALAFAAAFSLSGFLASASAQDVACYESQEFRIAAQENPDSAGTTFTVTKRNDKATKTCRFDPTTADFVIGGNDDQPFWYLGLVGAKLALTASTGPAESLIVYDLERREPILNAPVTGYELGEQAVSYWERVGEGTRANCPDFSSFTENGLEPVIAAETVFDLASGEASRTGETRCDAMQ
ncbi:hypothetical protein [Aurantimonas sp. VKM B-3413]|uniref:hypothetical protein n=1 Tax=Aurantimonas sp. VKM B-3413 TaxID=2779401 RepID=UPI001E552308|nr:hypothetical protein [Aurantimonas sp. VKM B-3413]MCB8839715.1 hypothetical protein [Aurantimonas sp. VKM B-3413]